MWNYRLSKTDASRAGMTTGGEEGVGEEGTISLDSSNVDTRAENIEMTNMVDSNDTLGRITMNFALLLVVEEGDHISLLQTTTIDVQEGKIATAAMMDMEMNTILRREGVMGEIEGEVGGAVEEDVVTMTTT